MIKRETVLDGTVTRRQFGLWSAGGLAWLSTSIAPRDSLAAPAADGALRYNGPDAIAVAVAGVARGAGAETTRRAVRAAARASTDFSWLSRGDTVLIKPVCNSGNAYPATTDPIALSAMIGLLREQGAGRVMVADMSGVESVRFSKDSLRGSTRALMQRNRMAAAAESAGAEVHAFEESGWDAFYDERPLDGAHWIGPVMMPNILREADHVVLMPRCARHMLTGATLGMKAAVGWWRHDSRLEYHRDAASLAAKTAEANTVPSLRAKQRLVLSSATQVLTTYGPDRGHVSIPPTGLIIASSSVTAHDMVALAWLLENRALMPAAARDGFIDDPNSSSLIVDIANRVVTNWLGGVGSALRAERLRRFDLNEIWDDRVLQHAFVLGGGVPRLELATDGPEVPQAMQAALRRRIQIAA